MDYRFWRFHVEPIIHNTLNPFKEKHDYDPIDYTVWKDDSDWNVLASWASLTEKHKCQFAEICCLLRTFCDLFNNHFEDLSLFAMTNHNIRLRSCFYDPISIFFFASHKDDIIDYKKTFFSKHIIEKQYIDRFLSVERSAPRSKYHEWKGGDFLDKYELFISGKYELVPGMTPTSFINCLKKTEAVKFTYDELRLRVFEQFHDRDSITSRVRSYWRETPTGTLFFDIRRFWSEEMEFVAIQDGKEMSKQMEEERNEEERKRTIAEEKRKEEERNKAMLEQQRLEREHLIDYNFINRHERDALLSVPIGSHCSYNGIEMKPVTDFVSEFFPKFDKETRAKEISDRTGEDVRTILKEWEEAVAAGSLLHKNIDLFFHNKQSSNQSADFKLFLDFYKEHQLNPYRSEWTIYDDEAELAGTVDFLDFSDGRFTLYDWKRSKNLINGEGVIKHNKYERRMGYYPIADIEDLPFWHYALQQNIYRYILGKCYGIEVKRMKLVVLHPSLRHYEIIDVPKMEPEITKLIQTRL